MTSNEVRERSFLQSFLDVLIQSILLAFLFVSPWFYGLTRFRDQLLAQGFIFSLFLLTAPFLRGKNGFNKVGKNPFDTWVFLGLAAGFFYVLFSSLPYLSLLAFLRLLGCVLFYGWVRRIVRTDRALRNFLWAILILGVFYSVYGLLQYYGFLPHPYWYQPSALASRYVNGGHFATLLLFPLFIGISLLASSRKIFLQCLLVSLLIVIGWGLLLTHSRAAWLAFLVGLGIFVSLAFRNRFLNGRTLLGMVALAGVAGLLFLSQGGLGQILGRFEKLWGTHFYSLVYRWQLWEGALSAIRERPWGWGLGTLSSVMPQYRVQADRFFIDYIHNEFLQVGVDLGIPGMLFLAGFVFFYLQKARQFLRGREVTDSQKAIAAGFLALWVSLVLVSQVDFPLRIYATGILFAAFLGLSAYLFGSLTGAGNVVGKRFWAVPWILVLIANLLTARQLFAELHFQEGKRLEEGFSWKEALAEYEKAARLSPFFARYHEALGYLDEQRAKIIFDPHQRKDLLKKAIRAYQEASRLDPYRAVTHYLLASLYEEDGEFLHAQAEFLKAISLAPTNALFVSEYGYFALRHSFVEEAIASFEKVKGLPFHGEAKTDLNEILKLCYRQTQDYEQLGRVIPDNVPGHLALGYLMGESGQWGPARKEFQRGMDWAKETSQEWFQNVARDVAKFYHSHNRFREALEIYQELAAGNSHDEEIKRKVEELHERLFVGT